MSRNLESLAVGDDAIIITECTDGTVSEDLRPSCETYERVRITGVGGGGRPKVVGDRIFNSVNGFMIHPKADTNIRLYAPDAAEERIRMIDNSCNLNRPYSDQQNSSE